MIPLTTVLVVLALGLLILGWRGRIVDRGVYCRKCRFDLDGIDRATPDACCPECGSGITEPASTRPTLRRKRWGALVPGVLLLLVGLTLSGIAATNNTAKIMALFPDRVVVTMHDLGFDAAFTEIATNRLVRLKNPLSDETWDGLIADALAHQQDSNTAWDPRHGEVLANALIDGRLTEDQMLGYVRLAIDSYAEFPATLRHGTDVAGIEVMHTSSARVSALTSHGTVSLGGENLMIWKTITRAGLLEPDYSAEIDSTSGGIFSVPGPNGRSMGGSGGRIPLGDLDWSRVEPNTDVTFFVEYQIEIKASFQGEAVDRWTQKNTGTVRILPADAQLVKLNTDSEIIESFRSNPHVRVAPLYIPPPEERNAYGSTIIPLESDFINSELPVALAGDLYVVHDGQEVRVSGISAPASQGIGIRMFNWRVDTEDGVDEAMIQSWLDAGSVTLEYRPDPEIAEKTHDIREILGVPLRFSDVPVTAEKSPRQGYSNEPADNETIARPIDD